MEKTFVSTLTLEENQALQEAFCGYLSSIGKREVAQDRRHGFANALAKDFKPIFLKNPEVARKYKLSTIKDNHKYLK